MRLLQKSAIKVAGWLRRPYPYPTTWFERTRASFLVSALVYLILLTFKPFGISKLEENVIWLVSGYSFITLFVMLFTAFVLPYLAPGFFDPNRWDIGKYLIHILVDYLAISLLAWALTLNTGLTIFGDHNFASFLLLTFAIGFFPVLSIIYIYERILFLDKLRKATILSDRLKTQEGGITPGDTISLAMGSRKPNLVMQSDNFLCAKSSGNYCMVYFRKEEDVQHILVRISISALAKVLSVNPSVVRCHRSALINMNHIEKFGGNARNFFLIVKGTDLQLDISRQVPDEILSRLQNRPDRSS